MALMAKLGPLVLLLLLAGCASHELSQQNLAPATAAPYSSLRVQVQFDTPEHADYLANQLVAVLARHGVAADIVPNDSTQNPPGNPPALLQLRLTDAWTETFISTRHMPRRSLTQMRGRIPRESPRFSTEALLVDQQTDETVWQLTTQTAGPWYSHFDANADSLVARLLKELAAQGLIPPRT